MMEWEPDDEYTEDGPRHAGYQEPPEQPKQPGPLFWFLLGAFLVLTLVICSMLLAASPYIMK
jgi:hypothetical protein